MQLISSLATKVTSNPLGVCDLRKCEIFTVENFGLFSKIALIFQVFPAKISCYVH